MQITIINHRDGTITVAKRGDPQQPADRRELAAFLAPPAAPLRISIVSAGWRNYRAGLDPRHALGTGNHA